MLNEPLAVKLVSKKMASAGIKPANPIIGSVVERKTSRSKAVTPPITDEQISGSLDDLNLNEGPTLEQPLKDDITRDSDEILASMSQEEREEHLAWIKNNLSQDSIRFLLNRRHKE